MWETFSIEFTTTGFSGTVSNARLQFQLAAYAMAGDIYYIDNVVLEKINAPLIYAGPVSTTKVEGESATFIVIASGTAPLSWQWWWRPPASPPFAIAGATSASYKTDPTTMAYSGSQFWCIVSNSAGSVKSEPAVLTVVPNLVSNPGFESGTSPWFLYTNGTGTFAAASPGSNSATAAKINIISTIPRSFFEVYQSGLTLEANQYD